MFFWKKKRKDAAAEPEAEALSDALEREPSAELEPEATKPSPAPQPAPDSAPVATVERPTEAGASLPQRRGRTRSAEQRLVEDPVRIFGEVSSLLARDPLYAARPLSDLGWMIRPALAARQVLVARARPENAGAGSQAGGPVAFIAWANLSDEIDAALRQGEASVDVMKAHADAWRSGPHPWIVALTGPEKVRLQLLAHLQSIAPKGARFSQLRP